MFRTTLIVASMMTIGFAFVAAPAQASCVEAADLGNGALVASTCRDDNGSFTGEVNVKAGGFDFDVDVGYYCENPPWNYNEHYCDTGVGLQGRILVGARTYGDLTRTCIVVSSFCIGIHT